MTGAPAPLTPADCDLRDFRDMPLDVVRVIDSDTFALLDAADFKAAFALWCKAWHQVPAGSIPDDDRILARFAGLSLAEWQGARPRILESWTHCDDGRFYHPVVAEKALFVLIERLDAALKGGVGNQRRWGTAFDRDGLLDRRRDVVGRLLALNPAAKVRRAPGERNVTDDRTATPEHRTATDKPSPRTIKPSQPKRSEGNGIDSSLRSESVESLTRERAPFDRKAWFDALTAAAGPGLADPSKSPALWTGAAELDAWAAAGVDLALDAIPVVASATARARADPVGSWAYFRKAVLKAHAQRTADLSPDLDEAKTNAKADHARSDRPADRHARSAAALEGVLKARKLAGGPTPAE